MSKHYDSPSDSETERDEYDIDYGSPDEYPPSQEEIYLREGEKIYEKRIWYLIIIASVLVIVLVTLAISPSTLSNELYNNKKNRLLEMAFFAS